MRISNFILSIFLFTAFSAAWPWPPTLENINNALVRRQNDNPKSTQSSGDKTTAEPASKTAERTAKETGKKTDSADNTKSVTKTGDKSEASASETGTQTGKKAKSTKKADKTEKASKTSSVSIDPAGAQGAISMITPAMTSSTYIKIGDEVTFVWNYTNLIVTPSKIDVVASNTDGAWTIASNITCKETGSVVWNTSDEATPLPMESYTFIVYDSEEGPTAVPKAGHLSPYQNYPFAMYSPRNPEGTGTFFCVTCSGAITAAERQSLSILMLVATITVLSFTWFTSGFLGA